MPDNEVAKYFEPPQYRHQLEVARTLTNGRVPFVVVPVFTVKELNQFMQWQAQRLEAMADVSERQTEG